MKIKKHGKRYDDGTPLTGKCNSCSCEVEVVRKELKRMEGDRPGEVTSYYVICPECSSHIFFKDRRLGNEVDYSYSGYER